MTGSLRLSGDQFHIAGPPQKKPANHILLLCCCVCVMHVKKIVIKSNTVVRYLSMCVGPSFFAFAFRDI